VLLLPSPIFIVGDIHGQLDDLLYLFGKAGALPTDVPDDPGAARPGQVADAGAYRRPLPFDAARRFLFMGDYVDRGYHSLHTFLFLCALKLQHPQAVHLLRGNHESRQISNRYGFYQECVLSYGHAGLWALCADAFDLLPLAALVDQDVFCVHGGLSPRLPMIEKISLLERQAEIPQSGPVADLCWSDPENVSQWRENTRGAGYLFGFNETTKFTRINRLCFVARSHQLAMEGVTKYFDGPQRDREFRLITIWSAPNYSYRSGNKAAIMALGVEEEDRKRIIVFDQAPARIRIKPADDEMPAAPFYFA
jgi:diadenosine tetraphosphatase ApaH/serine/threonine PP2A family protein phosphatase